MASIVGWVLIAAALLAWAALMLNLANLKSSDPAGNGLAQAFAVGIAFVLWALLALAMAVVGLGVGVPGWVLGAALLLLPLSGAAALAGFSIVTARGEDARAWLGIVLVAAPPVILAYAGWAMLPSLHAHVAAPFVAPAAWTTVLVLSLLPWWPLQVRRLRRKRRLAARR